MDKRERAIELIKRLLALSKSSNVNEAALAMAKAQELLTKYNLEQAQIEAAMSEAQRQQRYDKSTHSVGGTKAEWQWRKHLLNVLASTNFRESIGYTGEGRVALVGQPHNVEVVVYLYDYLVGELKRIAKDDYKRDRRTPFTGVAGMGLAAYTRAFMYGAAQAIHARLAKQSSEAQRTDSATMALVVQSDADLKAAVTRYFPSLKYRKAQPVNRAAYESGQRAGQTVAINPGIRGGAAGKVLQLA